MGFWCSECHNVIDDKFDIENNQCKQCNSQNVINIPDSLSITFGELFAISKISKDKTFCQEMINLKEKDPIEFQLKLAQFKATTAQQESVKSQEQNIPKCPTCGSTNIKKISAGSRWLSTGLFGISSSKLGKSMECRNCGYKW